MKRDKGQGLGHRVGSLFENGYGGEGWLAKAIYVTIMLFLMVISVVLGILMAPSRLVGRIKRRDRRSDETPQ